MWCISCGNLPFYWHCWDADINTNIYRYIDKGNCERRDRNNQSGTESKREKERKQLCVCLYEGETNSISYICSSSISVAHFTVPITQN